MQHAPELQLLVSILKRSFRSPSVLYTVLRELIDLSNIGDNPENDFFCTYPDMTRRTNDQHAHNIWLMCTDAVVPMHRA